jgi:MEMO1 family protein
MTNTDSSTRCAAVAGLFYADDPQQLNSDILQYLSHAHARNNITPRAIIAPHAGYIYSGPIAASAYKLLQPVSHKIHQIILLGPSHRVAFKGIATPGSQFFSTPLGAVKINMANCARAQALSFVDINKAAHKDEHSLEVHLPFLQSVLADFELTPLVVGDCNKNDVASLLDLFWNNDETLIIISTDLSHFHDYATAQKQDELTSEAIRSLQADKIHYEDACGRNPLNGLLTLASQRQLKIDCVDLRNSGDTAGDKSRVVGYGSYVVY